MSPEAQLVTDGELYFSPAAFDPASYVDSLRELVAEKPAALKAKVSARLNDEILNEQAASRALVEQEELGETNPSEIPEDITRMSDGFAALMGRIVKVSARAAHNGHDIRPFTDLEEEDRDRLRGYVLTEYRGLCDTLAGDGAVPSRTIYEKAPFLYIRPEVVGHLMEDNADLGRGLVARLITHNPVDSSQVIDQVRDRIEEAYEKFPTLSRSDVRKTVAQATGDHEAALRRYAESRGLVVDVDEQPIPSPRNFLTTLRRVARDKRYNLRNITLPPEMVERASKLGEEVLGLMDETGEYRRMREGISKKVETLSMMATKAWREGDLPTEPSRAPTEFRRGLYEQVISDFAAIHSLLSVKISKASMKQNPVEYYGPEDIRRLIADNPDLPLGIIRGSIVKNPADPQQVIDAFNDRVREIMEANPRLLKHEARDIARNSRASYIPEAGETRTFEDFDPAHIMERVRAYLNDSMKLDTNHPGETAAEIKRWRPEIEEYMAGEDWTFAGVTLPEAARQPLLKKLENFIVITEHAYRHQRLAIRLADFDAEQRQALYGSIASEFSEIGRIMKTKAKTHWGRLPTLYMSPAEVAQLREEYAWLSDKDFHQAVSSNTSDARGALARTARVKQELHRLYPGISEAMATEIAIGTPFRASGQAMARLRKITEGRSRLYDSKNSRPNPKKPGEILVSLKTELRHGVDPTVEFDSTVESYIARVVERTAGWLEEQDEAGRFDGKAPGRFLDHVERYLRASQILGDHTDYPRLLDLPAVAQNKFIEAAYKNQRQLNEVINGYTENGEKFRIYEFGFYHDAKYMKQLWKLYSGYLPRNLITLGALLSPLKPINRLNDLVEYQAQYLEQHPDATMDTVNRLLGQKLRANGK